MSPTICLSIQNAKVQKGHNADKINQFVLKVNQGIYLLSPISSPSFQVPYSNSYEITCLEDFIISLYKGHNSYKEYQIKNGQENLETPFSYYKSTGHFNCYNNQFWKDLPQTNQQSSPISTLLAYWSLL